MSSDAELDKRARSRVGGVLRGKYRLDSVLGIGGMAVVYRATHRNQAEFALKMLHPELSIREDIRTRFLREGYAANSVKHPGAVLVVDDDVAEDGSAFIVMELLDGISCEDLWTRAGQRMPANVALAIGHQLLDVLASAHDKGIVHRDIKPANIFITRDGTVKVLDFGIARARDAMANQAQSTGTGMLLGTPAFMAPEQALAKASEIDGQTDVWAVGATLFVLIGGAIVHEGDNGPQIMVKAATQPARSIATLAPHIPPQVTALVDRSLAFHKTERWASSAQFRDAIVEVSHACFGAPPTRDLIARYVASLDGGASTTALSAVREMPHSAASGASGAFVSAVLAAPTMPPVARTLAIPMTPVPGQAVSSPGSPPPMLATPPRNVPGGTTASPVSSDREGPAGVQKKGGPRTALIVGAAVGVFALAGIGFAVKSASDSKAAAAAADSAAVVASAPPPGATTSSGPAAVAVAPPSASSAPAVAVSAAPVASAAPLRPATGTGNARPQPAASAAVVQPPVQPAKPKPNCNPNYYLDANGDKHFKPQCF